MHAASRHVPTRNAKHASGHRCCLHSARNSLNFASERRGFSGHAHRLGGFARLPLSSSSGIESPDSSSAEGDFPRFPSRRVRFLPLDDCTPKASLAPPTSTPWWRPPRPPDSRQSTLIENRAQRSRLHPCGQEGVMPLHAIKKRCMASLRSTGAVAHALCLPRVRHAAEPRRQALRSHPCARRRRSHTSIQSRQPRTGCRDKHERDRRR